MKAGQSARDMQHEHQYLWQGQRPCLLLEAIFQAALVPLHDDEHVRAVAHEVVHLADPGAPALLRSLDSDLELLHKLLVLLLRGAARQALGSHRLRAARAPRLRERHHRLRCRALVRDLERATVVQRDPDRFALSGRDHDASLRDDVVETSRRMAAFLSGARELAALIDSALRPTSRARFFTAPMPCA